MSQIPRLYIAHQPLQPQQLLVLDESQSHYLMRVLRLEEGAPVKLLGSAGEWLAHIQRGDRKALQLLVEKPLRPFHPSPDIWLCFSPVKNEKIDFLARRATELGASALWPVRTDYTQTSRLNAERLTANMVEAAEQCSRMDVPVLYEYMALSSMVEGWDQTRILFHADESGQAPPLHTALQGLKPGQKAAILIGPEGGFSAAERTMLASKPFVRPCTLGPRILRAETAALVGLAHLQAWLGDGQMPPHFVTDTPHSI